jgi:hypothetical protein
MNTIILIILALAILLFPFRRHVDSPQKIRVLYEKVKHPSTKHFMPIRFIYLAFALFWLFLNKNNVFFSQWDAHRIGIPMFWYTSVPAFLLLFYALFPTNKVWTLPVVALVLGWALHIRKTIAFSLAHMNVKTDVMGTVEQVFLHVLLLVLCIGVLYLSGPYAKKRLVKTHQNT